MIHARVGFTEAALIFYNFSKNYKHLLNDKVSLKLKRLIRKLYNKYYYKSCGYYDKNAKIFNETSLTNCMIKKMYDSLKNSDTFENDNLNISHIEHLKKDANFYKLFNIYKESLSIKNSIPSPININNFLKDKQLYRLLDGKDLLIISSIAPLIKQQIENGNCQKIWSIPLNVRSIQCFRTPYCFMNDGPHQNALETLEWMMQETRKYSNYNAIIISCGTYTMPLARYLYELSHADTYCMGGLIAYFFGICTNRHHYYNKLSFPNHDLWIHRTPAEYVPSCYNHIEGGCYWIVE
jgi:hypothetical protein